MRTIPAHETDEFWPVPRIRVRNFFIIKAQLDEDTLRNALDQLIRNHWRELGARLSDPTPKTMTYQLPESFDDSYELFGWSSERRTGPITDALPMLENTPTESVSLLPGMDKVEETLKPKHWPQLHASKDPILMIHLVFFSDVTVLATNHAHILADQFGLVSVLKACLGVIRGQDPPPLLGFDKDILPNEKTYADYTEEQRYRIGYVHVKRRFEYPLVILGLLPDLIMHSAENRHVVFLPIALIESLRERYVKEIVAKFGADPGITNGDVISSIMTKFSRLCDTRPKWVNLQQVANLRNRIPALKGPQTDGFLHNALYFLQSRFQFKPDTRASEIAYHNRQAIIKSLEPDEMEMVIAIQREMRRRKQGSHITTALEQSYAVVNWTSAWRDLDFSAAVKKNNNLATKTTTEKEGSAEAAGKPDFLLLGNCSMPGNPNRYAGYIMFKGPDGYWLDFAGTLRIVKAIRAHLARDPDLDEF